MAGRVPERDEAIVAGGRNCGAADGERAAGGDGRRWTPRRAGSPAHGEIKASLPMVVVDGFDPELEEHLRLFEVVLGRLAGSGAPQAVDIRRGISDDLRRMKLFSLVVLAAAVGCGGSTQGPGGNARGGT